MKVKGITLVEILVVVGIIAILMGILIPVAVNAKQAGYQTSCVSNMRQLHIAYTLYGESFDTTQFPPTSLALLGPYVSDKSVFQCPVEHSIKPRPDGTYSAWVMDLLDKGPSSPFRISYAFLPDNTEDEPISDWRKMQSLPNVGLIACLWHGKLTGFDSPVLKHLAPRDGPFLRICFDGHLFKWMKAKSPNFINKYDLFWAPYSSRELFGP